MRTANWDAIAASAPLDAKASTVRDGSGDLWDPKINTQRQWDLCPPLAEITEQHTANPSFRDITGHRFGRLVVKGMLDYSAAGIERKENQGAAWVCRCACGEFAGFYRKSLLKLRADQACHKCEHLKHLQWVSSNPATRKSRAMDEARLDKLAARA